MVPVAKKIDSKRVYDKKNYCAFCPPSHGGFSKIAKHLESQHSEQPEIARALQLKKDEKAGNERDVILEKVRKKGNFLHNRKVLQDGIGELHVEQRPTQETKFSDFLPCKFCLAFYHNVDLTRHMKACKFSNEKCQQQGRVQGKASMLISSQVGACDRLQEIFGKMKVDDISLCVKNDDLLVKYGNSLCKRHLRDNREQDNYISNKVREVARLLLEVRKYDDSVVHLRNMLQPSIFSSVIDGVFDLCGLDDMTGTILKPSIGIKLGISLGHILNLVLGEAIEAGDQHMITQCEQFERLISLRWNNEINRLARIELDERKWNRPKLIPLTADVQCLTAHIKMVCSSAVSALATDDTDVDAWRRLASGTLVLLMTFNRKRSGEVAKITTLIWKELRLHQPDEEVLASLSDFEKSLCSKFKLLHIKGKKGRKVPVIVSSNVEKYVTLLNNTRDTVGVSKENLYLFATPTCNSVKFLRGSDVLRKFVNEAELKCPEAVFSTNLRKHIAIFSQLLDLQKNELDMLAGYMGHDLNVHRQFYRLPEDTLQLAKCGKLLLMMESGMGKYAGMTLDSVQVDGEGQIYFWILPYSVFRGVVIKSAPLN